VSLALSREFSMFRSLYRLSYAFSLYDCIYFTSCYAFATRGDDTLFSSFLNAMVITTIHAQEIGATRKTSTRMPLTSLFGNKFLWAMRDAVSYGGNYDEIYINNFGLKSVRGRNEVNSQSGPQLLTRPGIPKLSQSL